MNKIDVFILYILSSDHRTFNMAYNFLEAFVDCFTFPHCLSYNIA